MAGKILIVGGNGYIGSQTNLYFQSQNLKTVVLDKRQPYFQKYLLNSNDWHTQIADLMDIESLEKVFKVEKFDCVIHFAAYIEVKESQLDPEKYYFNNVVGTLNLLKTMRKFGVNNLVFSSTAAVYGNPIKLPIQEDDPKSPINTYGYTKWIMENILADYSRSYDFKTICLRYFNACGADPKLQTGEKHEPESHLIPLILQTASGQRESISVFGTDYNTFDGTCVRDYIHTLDLANAHYLAYEKLKTEKSGYHNIFNLGTKNGYSIKQILETTEKTVGKKLQVKFEDRRPGDPAILIADNTKASQVLGWTPKHSDLNNIIQTAWKWHLKVNS